MKPDQIMILIVETLKQVQELGGRAWVELKEESRPLVDLEGFDSLMAIEATALIEGKLGKPIADENLFAPNGRPLSLKQICERVVKLRSPEVSE